MENTKENISLKISTADAVRRRRYRRSAEASGPVALTPAKLRLLQYLAEMRFLSLPQLARLSGPCARLDLAEKGTRRHMRALFDAGLVDVIPVSRAALAPPGVPNDASLLYGSAPNVYAPTKAGLGLLRRAGLIGEDKIKRPAPVYGPRNGLFLAHELAVRDVRVWLEESARERGQEVETWRDGEEAAIGLGRAQLPLSVRPDAWFVYRLGKTVLVGIVEVDRGTERGGRRWGEKLAAYGTLFAGDRLRDATGYVNARVLVVAPDARRRDALCETVGDADEALAARFWFANYGSLMDSHILLPFWRQPGHPDLQSLLPETF